MCALCMQWKDSQTNQSVVLTTVFSQSQIDMLLSSSFAKQEACWAELQRANESLQKDLPAGLEPAPLGTERSVVSSMPPNKMHRVIWLTICIFLQASRACDGDGRPDMKMSCSSIFTVHERVERALPGSLWWGNFQYVIKESNLFVFSLFIKSRMRKAAFHCEEARSENGYLCNSEFVHLCVMFHTHLSNALRSKEYNASMPPESSKNKINALQLLITRDELF